MIDTHSHILPGLDDGSPDVEHSLRMAEAAAAAGVTTVVCTPHLREFDNAYIGRARETVQEFRSVLEKTGIDLRLRLGFEAEAHVAVTASDDELRQVAAEGSKGLILVETPHWGWPVYMMEAIFRLRTLSLIPLLAHPERNDHIQRQPDLLTQCLDAGAVAQGTSASLDGRFGRKSKIAFSRHLTLGHYSILASDAHSDRPCCWTVEESLTMLRHRLSEEEIDILIRINPERVLNGEAPLKVTPAPLSAWRTLAGGL